MSVAAAVADRPPCLAVRPEEAREDGRVIALRFSFSSFLKRQEDEKKLGKGVCI